MMRGDKAEMLMMRSFLLFLLLVPSAAMPQPAPSAYDSVDPFIGTAAGGNTFPGATLPFGMIQWSPDTQADGRYHFGDKTMRGLSLTHTSGAGCALYGDVPVLPWPGELKENPNDYVLPFSHDHELAHPGYYSVEFDDGIKAELTVAARAGIGRFYFPAGIPRTLIFKAWSATSDDKNHEADSSSIQLTGHDTITGSVQG